MLVPPAPGVLCAEGLLAAGLKAEFSRTLAGTAEDPVTIEAAFVALEREAAAWLNEEHVPVPDRRITRMALMRYAGQGGELAVTWPAQDQMGGGGSPEILRAARSAFAEAHRRLNGFVLESPVELVTLRVEADGSIPAPARPAQPPGTGAAAAGNQEAWQGDGSPVSAAIYHRADLGRGDRLAGPAIITQLDATTLLPPGWTAEVTGSGALLLQRDA